MRWAGGASRPAANSADGPYRIALRAVHLDGFAHRDPADRLIVATALGLGATLVTGHRVRAPARVRTAGHGLGLTFPGSSS